jgi:MFS family permease
MTRLEEWRREWRAGLAGFLGTATGLSIWPSVSSLFIEPLQREFGWSRGEVVFAFNAAIGVAIAAPLFGRLIDRIGVRKVALSAMVATSLGWIALASMTGSLSLYYLIYLYTMTIGTCTSGLAFSRVVTAAFTKSRGLALAVSRLGMGITTAILPPFMFILIAEHGWRAGFLLLAGMTMLIAFPVTWFCVEKRHSDVTPARSEPRDAVGWRTHLRNPRILLICAAAALSFAPAVSIVQQLHPILVGKGLAAQQGAALVGVVGMAAIAGTLLSGVLVDRIWAPLVGVAFTLGPALGCLLLVPEQISFNMALIGAACIGLAQGAELDLVAYMIARYFGLRSYSTIFGITMFTTAILCAIFANMLGQLYDFFGNYRLGITISAGSLAVAALCYLGMGRYPTVEPDKLDR